MHFGANSFPADNLHTRETYQVHSESVNNLSTGLGSSVSKASAPRSGGTEFDPGTRHTIVVNNGTSCSPLGTRIFEVGLGLVAPVSV